MILNKQTWIDFQSRAKTFFAFRPDLSVVQTIVHAPDFQKSCTQGFSILTGSIIGLLFWSVFQTTPQIAPYTITVSFQVKQTTTAQSVAEEQTITEKPILPEISKTDFKEIPIPKPETIKEPEEKHPPEQKNPVEEKKDSPPEKTTLPLTDLIEEKAPYGALPIIRPSDGLRPFDAYRKTFPSNNLSKPLIVLVMLDYGLSEQASKSVLDVFPENINFVLSNSAQKKTEWIQKAYDHGHEVWLDLAVEPENYPLNDRGTHTLLTSSSVEKNQDSLFHQLGSGAGYAGVFVSEKTPYFSSGADADFVANSVFERGLGLAINTQNIDRVVRTSAIAKKAPFYTGSMFTLTTSKQTDTLFRTIENDARKNGFSIVLFYPFPTSQKFVLNWIGVLKASGFALAPLSVIAERGAELSH